MDAYRLEIRSQRFGIPAKGSHQNLRKSKCTEDIESDKPRSRYVIS
jgi:hypothetical protein